MSSLLTLLMKEPGKTAPLTHYKFSPGASVAGIALNGQHCMADGTK